MNNDSNSALQGIFEGLALGVLFIGFVLLAISILAGAVWASFHFAAYAFNETKLQINFIQSAAITLVGLVLGWIISLGGMNNGKIHN